MIKKMNLILVCGNNAEPWVIDKISTNYLGNRTTDPKDRANRVFRQVFDLNNAI
jgi:hypothetical protein